MCCSEGDLAEGTGPSFLIKAIAGVAPEGRRSDRAKAVAWDRGRGSCGFGDVLQPRGSQPCTVRADELQSVIRWPW